MDVSTLRIVFNISDTVLNASGMSTDNGIS